MFIDDSIICIRVATAVSGHSRTIKRRKGKASHVIAKLMLMLPTKALLSPS